MRTIIALATILVIAGGANAQDIGKKCSADADGNGLHGRERIAFQAKCKAENISAHASVKRRSKAINFNRELTWEHHNRYCLRPVNNVANVLVGSCPPCVLLLSLAEDDERCYSR